MGLRYNLIITHLLGHTDAHTNTQSSKAEDMRACACRIHLCEGHPKATQYRMLLLYWIRALPDRPVWSHGQTRLIGQTHNHHHASTSSLTPPVQAQHNHSQVPTAQILMPKTATWLPIFISGTWQWQQHTSRNLHNTGKVPQSHHWTQAASGRAWKLTALE
jgi:hypothetical protein